MTTCQRWLENLFSPNGPLKEVQILGRKSLKEIGMPTSHIEEWRLTNLEHINQILNLPIANKKTSKSKQHLPKSSGSRETIQININNKNLLSSQSLYEGIEILSLGEIEKILLSKTNRYDLAADWPIAINYATSQEIIGLKITGNNLPRIELVTEGEENVFTPSRVLIVLEANSNLELCQTVQGSKNSYQSNLVEIYLGQGSQLNHGLIALGKEDSIFLENITVEQESSSNYSFTSIQHGWALSRLEPRIFQVSGGASTNLKGLQVATGNEQLATHSLVRFEGPEGKLEQLQKSAADKSSHCIFNGAVSVPREAQKTNASQLSRNLIMSRKARVDTKPELEIIADDVKCAHGATISQLQEDEIFYLRSRGITTNKATKLLLKGYCQEIINECPLAKNDEKLLHEILSGFNS